MLQKSHNLQTNIPGSKMTEISDICRECNGKNKIRAKEADLCPYQLTGGKFQGNPIALKEGKIIYECTKTIKEYAKFGVGG